MAGRYDDWKHRRGGNDRPDLISVGNKLLGYLEEQRRLNPGAPTQSISRTMPDGSWVKASFMGNIPKIEIRTAGGKKEEELWKSVIVVWPAPDVATRHISIHPQEAIKPPLRGQPEPWGHKGVPQGEGGAVDWRNADESIVISWHGPPNRYFLTTNNPYLGKIFCNGELIFNLSATPAPVRAGGTFTVRGAAVRGTKLMVMLRSHTGGTRYDRLIQLSWAEGQPDESTAVVMGERATNFEEFENSFYHPWIFNQDGTEARCLRGYSPIEEDDQYIREVVMSYNEMDDTVGFTTTDTRCPIITQTTIIESVSNPLIMTATRGVGGFATTTYADVVAAGGTLVRPFIEDPFTVTLNAAPGTSSVVYSFSSQLNSTVDGDAWIKCGVDYKNGAPVYLERRATTRTTNTSATFTPVATLNYGFSSSDATHTLGPGPFEVTVSGSASMTTTYTRNVSQEYTQEFTAINGGFRFSGKEILSYWTSSTSFSGELGQDKIMVEEFNGSEILDAGRYLLPMVDVSGNAVSGSHTLMSSGTQTTETSTDTLALLYADLRNGFAAFGRATVASTNTVSYSYSGDGPMFAMPSTTASTVTQNTGRTAAWTHERTTGPFAVSANSWPLSSVTAGTVTIKQINTTQNWQITWSGGTADDSPVTESSFTFPFGVQWYGNPGSGTSSTITRANAAPGTGTDMNSMFAQTIDNWHDGSWTTAKVFQQTAEGVRWYGSWQHLRGHLVYSQVGGDGGGGLRYSAGTDGPAIASLTPSYAPAANGMLYHPMFIHTKVR